MGFAKFGDVHSYITHGRPDEGRIHLNAVLYKHGPPDGGRIRTRPINMALLRKGLIR
jgi:hypothetical protein